MCELTTIGLVTGLLSSVVGAAGQMQQAQAQQDAADYQAQVDRNNAVLAQRQANDARARGDIEEQNARRKTAVMEGRQRAAFASRGVELDVGSPLDVLGDTVQFGEADALTVRGNAEREALGYEAKRMNFDSSAGLNTMKGEAAKQAGSIGAFGSLLSGAGSVASSWSKVK